MLPEVAVFVLTTVAARINRYINEGIKAFDDILYCLKKDESGKYRAVLTLME